MTGRLIVAGIALLGAATGWSQGDAPMAGDRYRVPAPDLAAVVDTRFPPSASIDPTNTWVLFKESSGRPPLSEISRTEVRLAGMRVNPETFTADRTYYYTSFVLKRIDGKKEIRVRAPEPLKASFVSWSGDGRFFAFCQTTDDGLELWLADAATGSSNKLPVPRLSGALGDPYCWMPDNKTLLLRTVPAEQGPAPPPPAVPQAPLIRENSGPARPARTYPDLIKSPYDEQLFRYYASSRPALCGIDGQLRYLAPPGMYDQLLPSPSGMFILAQIILPPLSRQFTHDRFPRSVQVWDREGGEQREIHRQPLLDRIPIARGAVPAGPRMFGWRADRPEMLCWSEARDSGDPATQAPVRDVVLQLDRPYQAEPETLARLGWRSGGVTWANDTMALCLEYWPVTRRSKTWLTDPSGKRAPRLLFDLSYEDSYADPGDPVTAIGSNGYGTLQLTPDGRSIHLVGRGASEEGDRPFIDRLDLATLSARRLWRSQKPYYTAPVRLLDNTASAVIVRRESASQPANILVMSLPKGSMRPLSDFKNPQPQFAGITKTIIRYRRDDGIDLSATLYLPRGYRKGGSGRLPLLLWAYPQDYQNASAAGQVDDTPYRFTWVGPSSPEVWLLRGFAVLDNPSMPIVARPGREANDDFTQQLVANARAAIQAVAGMGVADSTRVAVGGHSYGAFMTANLLTHSGLFRAGIAQSGAYNRTLTPFGFQHEDRNLWKARDVYISTSPFLCADSLRAPLLLVHGQD
ncbi:MAG: prolyl oligopeptidase family serine peptidase, partial [Candidatus Edwardsbacteria bacterium]|nr:prolyl oligopeptidase family serine peptidase [Candidatus Edwardsbacteria bacterium]